MAVGRGLVECKSHKIDSPPLGDHELDDRQRRIGRSFWPVNGYRRLWRRGIGACTQPFLARLRHQPSEFRGCRQGRFLRRVHAILSRLAFSDYDNSGDVASVVTITMPRIAP